MKQEKKNHSILFTLVGFFAIYLTVISIFAYLTVRTGLFLLADYSLYDKLVALLLLCAEGFIVVHGIGYFLNLLHVLRNSTKFEHHLDQQEAPPLEHYPPVAIVVSAYKEPLDVLRETLTCFRNLSYPNKHLYLLDDTRYDLPGQNEKEMQQYREAIEAMCSYLQVDLFRRQWRGAKAGMINDFLDFIHGRVKKGFSFKKFSRSLREETERYMIVFDADQNPFPDFVEPLVAQMEFQADLAFIQTPQYYTNFETNRVARASGLQQAVFYEYICEGKGHKEAMFCCGTNVIFRVAALEDVGGFDEDSVTEDFATSLWFHSKGWKSRYMSKVCAFGMGPEDLGAFFSQQFRWALGTIGLLRRIVLKFLKNPFSLPPGVWWEYFLSGSHYLVGWAFLIMVLCPILYLFFRIPTYFLHPEFYVLFFTPYLFLSISMFFWTLHKRRYNIKDLYLGILLIPISFPIYMKASVLGLIGVKGKFAVTKKEGAQAIPLRILAPQLTLSLICLAAAVWGMHSLYYERHNVLSVFFNSIWCLYFFLVLSGVFYFNQPIDTRNE